MNDQWYYGRGADIAGPVTSRELFAMAADGTVVVTDTVWQEGNERGVTAGFVEHLFSDATPAVDFILPTFDGDDGFATDAVLASAIAPPIDVPIPRPVTVRPKARATAGKGVVIVGQDGATVKYRMKCTDCGYEDSSWKSIAIPRGTKRTTFYCPKCRKKRETEIYGIW